MRGADRQLELLERLQALLRESKYTTTYKLALLHAFCDLALELPVGQHAVPFSKYCFATSRFSRDFSAPSPSDAKPSPVHRPAFGPPAVPRHLRHSERPHWLGKRRAPGQGLASLPRVRDDLLGTVTRPVQSHQAETLLGPLGRDIRSYGTDLFSAPAFFQP